MADTSEDRLPGTATRAVLVAFLVAVFACGALEVEAWPMSAFKLFSQTRTGTQVRWELVAVNDAGEESRPDFATMGRSFRQAAHLLPGIPSASPSAQQAACAGWLGAGSGAASFRIYRSVYQRPTPESTRVRTAHVLHFSCVDQ